jgi:hypothetical protein
MATARIASWLLLASAPVSGTCSDVLDAGAPWRCASRGDSWGLALHRTCTAPCQPRYEHAAYAIRMLWHPPQVKAPGV